MARFIPDDDWRDAAELDRAGERAELLDGLDPDERAEHREAAAARARRSDPKPGVPWQPSSSDRTDREGYQW